MTLTSADRVRWAGFALVAASALCWSSAGLFVRMVDVDVWSIVAWRSLFAGLMLAVAAALRGRRSGRRMGASGWFAATLVASASIAYIGALTLTTVANVLLIYACLPLVAAAMARFFLGESLSARVMVAGLMCLVGVAMVVGQSSTEGSVLGSGLAMLMTASFAGLLTVVRRSTGVDIVTVNAIGCFLSALVAFPLMRQQVPSPADLVTLALLGVFAMALAFLLFLEGGKRIGAGEAGLVSMLDVVLGPLWVWLAFNEVPGGGAVAGGVLILAALVWYLHGAKGAAAQVSAVGRHEERRS